MIIMIVSRSSIIQTIVTMIMVAPQLVQENETQCWLSEAILSTSASWWWRRFGLMIVLMTKMKMMKVMNITRPCKLWESSMGNIHIWKILTSEKCSPWKNSPLKIFTHEKYSPLKNIHPWKIFTPKKNKHPWKIFNLEKYSSQKIFMHKKYSFLKNINLWKIFTSGKYSPWKTFTPEKYSPWKNINPWIIFTPENPSTSGFV